MPNSVFCETGTDHFCLYCLLLEKGETQPEKSHVVLCRLIKERKKKSVISAQITKWENTSPNRETGSVLIQLIRNGFWTLPNWQNRRLIWMKSKLNLAEDNFGNQYLDAIQFSPPAHTHTQNPLCKSSGTDRSLAQKSQCKPNMFNMSFVAHYSLQHLWNYRGTRPHGLTFTWCGCCSLCLWHKPAELAHSFLFCSFLCLFLSLWPFQLYLIP